MLAKSRALQDILMEVLSSKVPAGEKLELRISVSTHTGRNDKVLMVGKG